MFAGGGRALRSGSFFRGVHALAGVVPHKRGARRVTLPSKNVQRGRKKCLSSIILSPLNGNVKMSPHETGDIHVESEGTAASERDQRMHQGRQGVCQRPPPPLCGRAPN